MACLFLENCICFPEDEKSFVLLPGSGGFLGGAGDGAARGAVWTRGVGEGCVASAAGLEPISWVRVTGSRSERVEFWLGSLGWIRGLRAEGSDELESLILAQSERWRHA